MEDIEVSLLTFKNFNRSYINQINCNHSQNHNNHSKLLHILLASEESVITKINKPVTHIDEIVCWVIGVHIVIVLILQNARYRLNIKAI